MRKMFSIHYLRIIIYRTYADLKAEASNGFVGILWWILEPLMYMGVFYFIFAVMHLRGDEGFVVFLLIGLVAWKWFASSVAQGAGSVVKMAALIQQVYLPKYIFPCVVILQNFFKYLFVLTILLIFLFFYENGASLAWFALPAIIAVQFLFTLGVVFVLAAIIPFVPDLKLLVGNALMMVFFLSGIIFDIHRVPDHLQGYLHLNPMLGLVENYRLILLSGLFPNWTQLGYILIASITMIVIGLILMIRYDRVYPKMLSQ